jgi:diketogulonate reductase-like aldo/keto reductase
MESSLAYGTSPGLREGLRASGRPRSSVWITTKVQCGTTRAYVAAEIAQVLAQLGVPSVDLLTIHYPEKGCMVGTSLAETWSAFEQAKAAGQTRFIGTSEFSIQQLAVLLSLGKSVPYVNQWPMSVGGANLTEILRYCSAHNIRTEGFSVLRTGCMNQPLVRTLAVKHNVSTAQVCIRFVTQLAGSAVVSSSSQEYDREDLSSTSAVTLSEEEMAQLASLARPG